MSGFTNNILFNKNKKGGHLRFMCEILLKLFKRFNKNIIRTKLPSKSHIIFIKRYVNPLTAGAADIRVFIFLLAHWVPHFKYGKDKMTSTSKIWKELTSILSNLNNFHSLEVVDRVSETQLQVGENSNRIIWQLKG